MTRIFIVDGNHWRHARGRRRGEMDERGERRYRALDFGREEAMVMRDVLDYLEVVVPPAYSRDECEVAASSLADHRSLVELRSAWLRVCEDAIAQDEPATLRPSMLNAAATSPPRSGEERTPRSIH